jgi:hypothetical protein
LFRRFGVTSCFFFMIAELVETDVALVRRRERVDCTGRLQDTEQSGTQVPKYAAYVIRVLIDIDVGDSMLICHVGAYLPDYTASRHKKLHLFGYFVRHSIC